MVRPRPFATAAARQLTRPTHFGPSPGRTLDGRRPRRPVLLWPWLAGLWLLVVLPKMAPGLCTQIGDERASDIGQAAPTSGQIPPGPPATHPQRRLDIQSLREQLGQLIEGLDAEKYELRREAAKRLEQLCTQPDLAPELAVEIRRALLRDDLSFEVRSRLERCAERLPAVPDAVLPAPTTPQEMDRVIAELQSPSFAVRRAAKHRLEWMVADPRLAGPLLVRLKEAMARALNQPDTWRELETAWHRLRGVWLLAGASQEGLPPAETAQINAWADSLARAGAGEQGLARRLKARMAEIQLLDALARDQLVDMVRQALEEQLRRSPQPPGARRLARLLELTQPAMVAEYWEGRRHHGEQHLLVGVPSLAAGATRPSHFDRIDDRTAHCVSGQTLSPGDYPVGVAFPHPLQETAFFHLVNLPNPRRRMAYAYQVQLPEAERLRAISRRTLDRLLAQKRALDEAELVMLAQLDPEEVSRFAARYLLLVDDRPLPLDGPQRIAGRPSAHGLLCGLLAAEGTRSAGQGLIRAIDEHRFLPPTSVAPYRLEYVAALAIARRDPWPGADQWLAVQVNHAEPLIDGRPNGPEVGATAAAILLLGAGESTARFGLEAVPDPVLAEFGVPGHRFRGEADRAQAERWWLRRLELRRRP